MVYIVDTLTWFAFRGLRVYTRSPPSHCSHGLHNVPPPLPAHGFTGLRNYGCTLVHTESQWVYWFTLVYIGYIVYTLTWFAFRGLRVYTRSPPSHCSHGLHNLPPSQPMGSRVYGIKALHWFTRNHNGFTGLHWFTWFTLLTPLHSLRLGVYGFTHVHLLHTVHMVYIIPPLLPTPGFTGLPDYELYTGSHGITRVRMV